MFNYPNHFTHPTNDRIYFKDHIDLWEQKLVNLKTKPNKCLEIGALYGAASVYMLESYCSQPGSELHIVDINTNKYIESNLAPYKDKVVYHIGKSEDVLRSNSTGLTKESFDLIYIDGNHMSKHVLEDAVNAFYLLKPGGILIFDDYGWGVEGPAHRQPKIGIDAFVYAYRMYLDEINWGWHVILQRNSYDMDDVEKQSNYYTNFDPK